MVEDQKNKRVQKSVRHLIPRVRPQVHPRNWDQNTCEEEEGKDQLLVSLSPNQIRYHRLVEEDADPRVPAGIAIAFGAPPLERLDGGIEVVRPGVLEGLFFYGDEVGVDDDVEEVDDGVEFPFGYDVGEDEEDGGEDGVAEERDKVVDNGDPAGLRLALVGVDEVQRLKEVLSPVQDVED